MVYSIKGFGEIKKEDTNILFLAKCSVPIKHWYSEGEVFALSVQGGNQIDRKKGDCLNPNDE